MLRIVWGIISFLLEPAFVEVKAALVAYFLAHPDYGSALTAIIGVVLCLAIMNGLAYFEGLKSLWSVHVIVRTLTESSLQIADTIPAAMLESRYGFAHTAFRFGPFAQEAGNLTVLYDRSGKFMDYQCAFNMLGNSYLFVPSNMNLEVMPLYQKYLALHELGHGSLMGGVIWIRAKSIIASGALACAIGLVTVNVSVLGISAVMTGILAAFLSSRKVVVESEAEVYADSYAIRHMAAEDTPGAIAVVKKLIERLTDVNHQLIRYDQLINKSRLRNLKLFQRQFEAGKSLNVVVHPSIRWLHYVAAILFFCWIVRDARPESYDWLLSVCFAALIIVSIIFRNHTIRKMFVLDRFIGRAIGR
ncbi:hypothetical protein IVA80_10350 [Bradyrhizobium sp. 139]|uniref:hypothetical protein n=1 Tax=Bradyrhizobium sp. 139 TaxID=2782616 RepID=UPI001FFBE636|nr:hypothetical protein [Bradyrhizobium sp. 139]MCK1741257.1 hypothetical protein [Bradyrhizobium sp. 139]